MASHNPNEGFPDGRSGETWVVYSGFDRVNIGVGSDGTVHEAVRYIRDNPFMAPEVVQRSLARAGFDPEVVLRADSIVNDLK